MVIQYLQVLPPFMNRWDGPLFLREILRNNQDIPTRHSIRRVKTSPGRWEESFVGKKSAAGLNS